MLKNTANSYWVPLISKLPEPQQGFGFRGKALQFPLSAQARSLYPIYKKSILEVFGIESWNGYKYGLFCDIQGSTYLLGIHNIITIPLNSSPNSKSILSHLDRSLSLSKLNPPKRGLKISIAGRLKGVNMAKDIVLSKGSLKTQTFDSRLDYVYRPVMTKWGIFGLRVFLG